MNAMKQLVFRLLPLLMLLIGSAASAQGLRFQYNGSSNLTTEQANADIDTLIGMMERIHPDLYANRSERSFKRDVASLHKHFAKQDSVNKFDLYIALMELIAPFNEGHLVVANNAYNRVEGNAYFPFAIQIDPTTHALVLKKSAKIDDVHYQAGDEITHINGIKAQKIIEAMRRQLATEKDFVRYSQLSDGVFNIRMAWLNPTGEYTLRLKSSRGRETINARGWSAKELSKALQQEKVAPYSYELLDDSTMLFHFNACQLKGFNDFAKEMFSTARERNIRHLIIDVRSNGGGNSNTGDEICRYISSKPFHWISHTTQRISEPVRQQRNLTLPDTLIHYPPITEEQLMQPYPDSVRFNGKCYLLMSHRTYSSAASFAWEFTHFGMGVAIGEEVGDPAISTGDVIYQQLPHSRFTVGIPYKIFYSYGILEGEPNRGALPDIAVPKDQALECALKLIREGR